MRWRRVRALAIALAVFPLHAASDEGEAADARPERVGRAPEQSEPRPEVTTLSEVGGVLTRRGTLRVEPTFEYAHSSVNRFNVRGFEVVQGAVLIGTIEAHEADRDTLTQALTLRYGVTNRIEVDVTIPGVYRNDRFVNTIPTQTDPEVRTRQTRKYGLGDVEFGAHYQVNRGLDGWPFVVANLRVKSRTGLGPFEVRRDVDGIEEELPTGSGFWGFNPSLTFISSHDPAVLYGNIGYLWNQGRSVDVDITENQRVFDVDPGDAINANFGIGLALTQDLSVNLGFDYAFVLPTETELRLTTRKSSDLQIASIQLGLGFRFSEMLATNLGISIGATEDAPDFRLQLRVPISIPKLFGD